MKEDFIILKDKKWLYRQKIAGRAVASALKEFVNAVKTETNLSLLDIEHIAVQQLKSFECTPTFFNYKTKEIKVPFPGKVCLSVNNVLVHGIPSNYKLKNGDVVTLDLGATYEGAIADAAFTCVFGETNNKIKDMLKTCQGALNESIKSIKAGKKLGVIGSTIFNFVKNSGFGLITSYGGHGIDYDTPHAPPFVSNKSRADDGVTIQPGLSIAIEPMLVLSKNTNTKISPKDKWSVFSRDIGCHFEHSVTLDDDGKVHIVTEHLMNIEKYV